MHRTIRDSCLAIAAVVAAALTASASAQVYPTRAVRIIVPYATGGAVDLMSRHLCDKFLPSMGQPCVVENKPSSSGIIGFEFAAKAEPDGYTLVMAPNNLAIIPSLIAKMPYDTLKDLTPIALVSSTPIMIGAHPSLPPKTFQEFIAYAKANPGKLNFTTCGMASPQHLSGEMLGSLAGFQWTHVPYKGCGQALADVLSGVVPVFISTVAHFNPQIKSGKLKGYAVMTAQRSQFAPDSPTVSESGFPGFQIDLWFGLLAPAKTPAPVLARVNAEVNKALQQPDLREKLHAQAYEPVGGTPERFAEVIRTDMARFGKVIKDIGIKAD